MNDWDDEKTQQYMLKAKDIAEQEMREGLRLSAEAITDPSREKEIIKRLDEIKQEGIVLKKLLQRIQLANLAWHAENM